MKEPYRLSALEALELIKKGDLTVEAYATSLLGRIQAREPTIKAWAYIDPDAVLAQARALDQVPPEARGPLHGIAIGVKDVFLTKGMPTVYNSPIYRDQAPAAVDAAVDAAAITTLRAAGALFLGETTTTEFASTTVGGPSANPHDTTRTPGGSSSGSGAAVGDYHVPIALGTQTGGSTIRPGSFNGIYAFKVSRHPRRVWPTDSSVCSRPSQPTWGAISREGFAQYSMTCDTMGFLARTAEDLELLSAVFRLADDEPIPTLPFTLKGSRVAFCKTHVWPEAGPGTQQAFAKAQALLKECGADVSELELPADFANISRWHGNVIAGEGRSSFLGSTF